MTATEFPIKTFGNDRKRKILNLVQNDGLKGEERQRGSKKQKKDFSLRSK